MSSPKLFRLQRDDDETGVSGTGHIADGIQWPDGTVALRWRTEHRSTAVYDSADDVETIHGHGGKTRIVWADATTEAGVRAAVEERFGPIIAEMTDKALAEGRDLIEAAARSDERRKVLAEIRIQEARRRV